jgi:hypothetical protein
MIDSVGNLYMSLTRDYTGHWWCSQIESTQTFSFGNFTFYVNASIDRFDPNVEFRMFTKGSDDQTNGIIIDIARMGQTYASAPDLWYTVYPGTTNESISENSSQIPTLDGTFTTHRFNWMNNIVTIEAEYDHNPVTDIYRRFNYYSTNTSWATSVPQIPAPIFISLCTYNGSAPINGQEVLVNINYLFWVAN